MKAMEIKKGIYWVGAKDWNVRDFHGYKTSRGTSYNAYLIVDEKIVLVDTVKTTHFDEMLQRISSIIDPKKIDMVVSNHVEMDHSGSLPQILKLNPKAKLITSAKGEKGLSQHYNISNIFPFKDWNIQVVGSGEELKIGKRTLKFIHTPMLHWPDSMITYIPEEKVLLPNDAFGQHYISEHLFDHPSIHGIVMEELAKYYANIVYPFSLQVKNAITALSDLDIEIIAPSHGVIWKENIAEVIKKYKKWSDHIPENKAVIIYDSMWGTTDSMANIIKFAFEDCSIPVIKRNLKFSHISDIINDILEAKYVLIGSPVLNNQVLPTMASLLSYIKGLRPKNKIGFAFGSYGWSPKTLEQIFEVMDYLKWDCPEPIFKVNYQFQSGEQDKLVDSIKKIIR